MNFFQDLLHRVIQRLNQNNKRLEAALAGVQQKSNLSLEVIIQQVEATILSKINEPVNLTTEYKYLGGANNFGFLCHELSLSPKNSKVIHNRYVTKFALTTVLKRERFFLQWHQNQIKPKKQFAPAWITGGDLEASTLSFMVMECLMPIKAPSFQQVSELFHRCQQGRKIFQLSDSVPVLEPGSRIRDVLVNVVCQFDSPNATQFLKTYFLERKQNLPGFQEKIVWIQAALNTLRQEIGGITHEVLGFVHGDFKASNMMGSSDGDLKLIDFQYWCYGIRIWDIAFFLSKQKKRFEKTGLVFIALLELSSKEKNLLIFSYIIAILLHPKLKQFNWQFKHQIVPALTMLNNEKITWRGSI